MPQTALEDTEVNETVIGAPQQEQKVEVQEDQEFQEAGEGQEAEGEAGEGQEAAAEEGRKRGKRGKRDRYSLKTCFRTCCVSKKTTIRKNDCAQLVKVENRRIEY